MDAITCEWFALCTNTTHHGVAHPILGVVPCCLSCAAKLDLTITHTLSLMEA